MYRLTRINLLILLLFSCLFITNVNALVDPTPEFYVNDYANILSQETEDYIVEKSKELYRVDGTQIVVVTVPNLEGKSIEEYSLNLARSFGIGSKEKNNGLLLLLALKERQSRVEVGTGLEGILPDGKTGRFQDEYMIPYFKSNNFDEGIKNGYNAFFNEIVKLNNLDLSTAKLKKGSSQLGSTYVGLFMLVIAVGYIFGCMARVSSFLQDKITKAYFIIGSCLIIISYMWLPTYFWFILFHLFGFLIGRLSGSHTVNDSRYSSSGSYYSSFSSSHSSSFSSSSHSSGGGGSFSGGGSSRHF